MADKDSSLIAADQEHGQDAPFAPKGFDVWLTSLDKAFEKWLTVENIEKVQESCPVQIVSHTIMGFGFGALLGLFLSGIGPSQYEMHRGMASPSNGPGMSSPSLTRETVKQIFKEMASKTYSSAKNLGLVAGLFTSFECSLESYRAKHDLLNTAAAGCLSGAVLARKSGPKTMALSCFGFAAFSCAVESFLQRR